MFRLSERKSEQQQNNNGLVYASHSMFNCNIFLQPLGTLSGYCSISKMIFDSGLDAYVLILQSNGPLSSSSQMNIQGTLAKMWFINV